MQIRAKWGGCYSDTGSNKASKPSSSVVSPVPLADNNSKITGITKENSTHPPSPRESKDNIKVSSGSIPKPPGHKKMSREEIRFLSDVATRPLSTTVSRYQRLNLSRRRGNAIRQQLTAASIIEAVTIATRSGQVVLYQLSEFGRTVGKTVGIDPGPRSRESLEHRFWINKAAEYYERKKYKVTREHPVKGNGAIDILAKKPGEKVAVEVETGKSDIKTNLSKISKAGFDRVILIATSPTAVSTCQKAVDAVKLDHSKVEVLTWLDVS